MGASAYAWQMIIDHTRHLAFTLKLLFGEHSFKESAIIRMRMGLSKRILKTCFMEHNRTQDFFPFSLFVPKVQAHKLPCMDGRLAPFKKAII